MSETTHSYRRRRYLVNRPLQLRFVKAIVFILLVMAVGAAGAVYLAVHVTLSSFDLLHDPLIVSLLNSVLWTIFLELLVLTPLVVWFGIRLTHPVAGPLVRIQAALAQLCAGDFSVHVSLRKGDELLELAQLINRLAKSLRERRPA